MCVALKDEIKMLIREDHFKEFMDEPQVGEQGGTTSAAEPRESPRSADHNW